MIFRRLLPSLLIFAVPAAFADDGNAASPDVPAESSADGATVRVSIPDDDPTPPPPVAFSKEEALLLKSLFSMSDKDLKRLREFILCVEKTPPEKRRQMARDLERWSADMTPEQRAAKMKEMRERFRKNQENLLVRYYATLPAEQAEAERAKFLSLDHKQRRAYIFEVRKKLGYGDLPPPPPPHDGNRRGDAPHSGRDDCPEHCGK